MNRLATRLMFTYALVALIGITALFLTVNDRIEVEFRGLVTSRIAAEQRDLAGQLAAAWSDTWHHDTLESFGMVALSRGYVLTLYDNHSEVIWDAKTHNAGLCAAMLDHMASVMSTQSPQTPGAYHEDILPVHAGEGGLSSVTIGYYGPFFFNDSEAAFVKTVKNWVIAIGSGALVLALLIGAAMARAISRPLVNVTETARQFQLGNFAHPMGKISTTREIAALTASIGSLGRNLSQQQDLRRRLTADISHELRTPLTILQGRLEALIDGVQVAGPDQFESMRQEVLRLGRLVGQLDHLKLAEGVTNASTGPAPQASTLDGPSFLASVLEPFRAEAQTRGISLPLTAEPVTLAVGEDAARQILINLLSNAFKYTPDGGTIAVSARSDPTDPARVLVSVADNGPGISAHDLPRLFDRFYRADESRTRATGGTGLGLAIARALAEGQGGTLTAASELGVGSVFTWTVPVSSAPAG